MCKAVAERLRSEWASEKFEDCRDRQQDLARRLRYPSRALLDALAKELGAAGGAAAVDGPQEAQRRAEIVCRVITPTDETGKSACLPLLDLFREIRVASPDVSAASVEPAEPRRPALALVSLSWMPQPTPRVDRSGRRAGAASSPRSTRRSSRTRPPD